MSFSKNNFAFLGLKFPLLYKLFEILRIHGKERFSQKCVIRDKNSQWSFFWIRRIQKLGKVTFQKFKILLY